MNQYQCENLNLSNFYSSLKIDLSSLLFLDYPVILDVDYQDYSFIDLRQKFNGELENEENIFLLISKTEAEAIIPKIELQPMICFGFSKQINRVEDIANWDFAYFCFDGYLVQIRTKEIHIKSGFFVQQTTPMFDVNKHFNLGESTRKRLGI